MIICHFHLPGGAVPPDEADAPTPIDTNAVLPLAIAPQGLQPIAGRCPQIVQPPGGIHCQQLRARRPQPGGWGYGLGFEAGEYLGAHMSGASGSDLRSGVAWASRAFGWELEAGRHGNPGGGPAALVYRSVEGEFVYGRPERCVRTAQPAMRAWLR